jgi:NADH-quinone oxidoreductase subunit E
MIPKKMKSQLQKLIDESEHPREQAVNVMYALQSHYGYLGDEAVCEAAELLHMTPLEIDELATFYDFIYREPVGKYVIHACDGVVCWMFGEETVVDYLCRTLNIKIGETTPDGLFTVLPSACIGYCDHAPAMLINGEAYGPLTREKVDRLLEELRRNHHTLVPDR